MKNFCGSCLKQYKLSATKVRNLCPQTYDELTKKAGKITEVKDNIDRIKQML